jgi:hypothetical protein
VKASGEVRLEGAVGEPRAAAERPAGVLWVTPRADGALDALRAAEETLLLAGLGGAELPRGLAALAGSWHLDLADPAPAPGIRGWLAGLARAIGRRLGIGRIEHRLARAAEFQGLVNHVVQYQARALVESERARRADREALESRLLALEARPEGRAPDGTPPAP